MITVRDIEELSGQLARIRAQTKQARSTLQQTSLHPAHFLWSCSLLLPRLRKTMYLLRQKEQDACD
jgi:hypothetical protein